MGLTHSSVGTGAARDALFSKRLRYTVALAGTPNVGKSSIFNALTGLAQHTGNWTGKTVTSAVGHNKREDMTFIDLPGTYSLSAHSPEEEVAREFIDSGEADAIIAVCDGLCLERSLVPALQIKERCRNVIICINFADEIRKRGVAIDTDLLSKRLSAPVIMVSARSGEGLRELCHAVKTATFESGDADGALTYPCAVEAELAKLTEKGYRRHEIIEAWCGGDMSREVFEAFSRLSGDSAKKFRSMLMSRPIIVAEGLANEAVSGKESCGYTKRDRFIDKIITGRIFSIPIMLFMLMGIFWLTIVGSNYPSAALGSAFDVLEAWIYGALEGIIPNLLREVLVTGVLRTLFRVISVMLPPMAIFFPLFTLMEDFGLLGRIAFNLDGAFGKCSACGKQALTMCMGLGCNAAGVVGCRIIDSPRERLIAILTNNFMPCNGRFPILITMCTLLAAGGRSGFAGALGMTAAIIAGVAVTLGVSKLLSATILKGTPSSFTLELPPYRRPQLGKVIVRSVFDRTLFVLGRAAAVAAPAGLVIWLFANINIGEASVLSHACSLLDPIGKAVGLDGAILCGFILGFPANEIVLPIIIMCYSASGSLGGEISGIGDILMANGWGTLTIINMMIMTLFHFPCSTTVLTVKKETGSIPYTILSVVLPTVIGFILCAVTTAVARVVG